VESKSAQRKANLTARIAEIFHLRIALGHLFFWKAQERPDYQPMMSDQNPTPQKSFFKNPLVYSSAVILIVALYVGWVLLSRRQGDRVYEHRAEEAQAKKQRAADQAAI
jgi:hypothetical protein